ncbi:MAG TPA: NADH-quinone oxidoreductase subunit C [Jiangellaceae bacterium]
MSDDERRGDKVEQAEASRADTSPVDQPGKAADGRAPGSDEKTTTGGDPTPEAPADDSLPAEPEGPQLPGPHPTRRGMFGVGGTGDTSGYGGLVPRDTNPVRGDGTPRPWGPDLDELGDDIAAALERAGIAFDDAIEKVVVDRGQITFFVTRERLPEVARTFRDDPALRFEMCMGVSGVNYPEETGRELHAFYPLLSVTHNRRVALEVVCPDDDPHIPSITATYPSNNWHERETYDFFGIIFDGHQALTRIQMPDDWPGHPQRKDYPLGGIPVEYKGATIPPPDERRAYN